MNLSKTIRFNIGIALCLALAAVSGAIVDASSARGTQANNYRNIFAAFHAYHDVFRNFARDGRFFATSLEMSWRVHVCPFAETPLPTDLLKATDWDQAIRLEKSLKPQTRFNHAFFDASEKAPILSRVLGPGTFFGDGRQAFRWDPTANHSRRLWFVEAEQRAGDHWMKPGDWNYDPENPHAGLSRYLLGRANTRGCMGIFGDGSIRLLSPETPDMALRDVISPPTDRPIMWDASFFEAASQPELARLFWPFLAFSAITGFAAFVVLARMLLRCDVQPGEIALLAVGVYQLTCLISFCMVYRFEYFPLYPYVSADHIPYWGWPTVLANFAMLLGAGYFRNQKKWSIFFLAVHVFTFLIVIPGLMRKWQHFSPEEALVYHACPLTFAAFGVFAIAISCFERPVRPWRHWFLLTAFFLPLAWQTIGQAHTGMNHDRTVNQWIMD